MSCFLTQFQYIDNSFTTAVDEAMLLTCTVSYTYLSNTFISGILIIIVERDFDGFGVDFCCCDIKGEVLVPDWIRGAANDPRLKLRPALGKKTNAAVRRSSAFGHHKIEKRSHSDSKHFENWTKIIRWPTSSGVRE